MIRTCQKVRGYLLRRRLKTHMRLDLQQKTFCVIGAASLAVISFLPSSGLTCACAFFHTGLRPGMDHSKRAHRPRVTHMFDDKGGDMSKTVASVAGFGDVSNRYDVSSLTDPGRVTKFGKQELLGATRYDCPPKDMKMKQVADRRAREQRTAADLRAQAKSDKARRREEKIAIATGDQPLVAQFHQNGAGAANRDTDGNVVTKLQTGLELADLHNDVGAEHGHDHVASDYKHGQALRLQAEAERDRKVAMKKQERHEAQQQIDGFYDPRYYVDRKKQKAYQKGRSNVKVSAAGLKASAKYLAYMPPAPAECCNSAGV